MSRPDKEPLLGTIAAIAWVVLSLLTVVTVVKALTVPLNHDVGWFLHVSQSMLNGEVLYRDVVEINLPMTAYLNYIPVLISNTAGLPIAAASTLWLLGLLFGVTTWALAPGHRPGAPGGDLPMVGATILLGAGLIPGGDFGQREHLMFILIVPYLLVLWRRGSNHDVSSRSAIPAGLVAGVGVALKPHFILILIGVEMVGWMGRGRNGLGPWRWFRSAERTTLLVGLAAYCLFVLVQGDYLPLLMMTAATYERFASVSRIQLATGGLSIALLLGWLVTLPRKTEIARLARLFLTVGLVSMVLVILQGKGWSYHFYPVMAGLAGAMALLAYDAAARASKLRVEGGFPSRALFGVTLSLVALLTFFHIDDQNRAATERAGTLAEQLDHLSRIQADGSFLVLSAFVSRSFPLANYASLDWASPFPALWWIRARPKGLMGGSPGTNATEIGIEDPAEVALTQIFVDQFRRTVPGTVLVDISTDEAFGGMPFPYVEYLKQNDSFRQEWGNYRFRSEVGPFAVWVRRETGDRLSGS